MLQYYLKDNWKTPRKNGLKGNWDATIDSATKFTGLGFVVQDSSDKIQLSSRTSMKYEFQTCHATSRDVGNF